MILFDHAAQPQNHKDGMSNNMISHPGNNVLWLPTELDGLTFLFENPAEPNHWQS